MAGEDLLLRLACPLQCGTGFLGISQLNEHLKNTHLPKKTSTAPRRKSNNQVRTIDQKRLDLIRVNSQSMRLNPTHEKVKMISGIVNDGKSVAIYHLDPFVLQETANAIIDDPKEAAPFIEALKAKVCKDPSCDSSTTFDLTNIWKLIPHICSLITQEGMCFKNNQWINLGATTTTASERTTAPEPTKARHDDRPSPSEQQPRQLQEDLIGQHLVPADQVVLTSMSADSELQLAFPESQTWVYPQNDTHSTLGGETFADSLSTFPEGEMNWEPNGQQVEYTPQTANNPVFNQAISKDIYQGSDTPLPSYGEFLREMSHGNGSGTEG